MAKSRQEQYDDLVKAIKQKTQELKLGKTWDGHTLDAHAKKEWREAIEVMDNQITNEFLESRPKPPSPP